MQNELIYAAFWLWLGAAALALLRKRLAASRLLLGLGCAAALAAVLLALPNGIPAYMLPFRLANQAVWLQFSPAALWLMGFGLFPALFACWLATPKAEGQASWLLGAAMSLIGAFGVFGLQDGLSFLIAWELMSLGGAIMILGERLSKRPGRPVLFMLGLLEIGAVALLTALLLLDFSGHGLAFGAIAAAGAALPHSLSIIIGILLLLGFGAKLGLLPFYEWFPAAYASGSGATGALLSGVILNAAFFGLSRGLTEWLGGQSASGGVSVLGVIVVAVGVLSAILAILYAFQQEDWRALLSFSTAENASVAVALLGASLLFRQDGLAELAGLAWTVAMLHLAGHALAKGGLFLTADALFQAGGGYAVKQGNWLRRMPVFAGVGALFAVMSLAAIPPQAGFVSEWYVFQTVFQGFHLSTLSGRLTLALAGGGLALTAAIALATFVKLFGLGLLGEGNGPVIPWRRGLPIALLGLGVLALAVGMPFWLHALDQASWTQFAIHGSQDMTKGWLLIPLTSTFAFISPSLLIIVMPLLALIPLSLLLLFSRRYPVRREAVWFGGHPEDAGRVATTALSFSNALRTFYSFIYRPALSTDREHQGRVYFIKRLIFNYEVAPLFGPYLFTPVTRWVWRLSGKLRALQSGNLNFYLALIGVLLIVILALPLF